MNNTTENMRRLLDEAIRETGRTLQQSATDVAAYAASRAAHLATIAGQPGFEEALRAERNAVAMFAGLSATAEADRADQRIVGIIHGALAIAAGA
jgi:hypothetical protein